MVLGSSPVAVTSSEDTLLYFDAIVEPSCQHFDNAVNITSKSYISKFSQVKCSIRSFYCAVLFIGCSAKKTLKSLLHRERLRKTRETLQISLFGSMFLILVKKTALHFLFTVLSYVQGALQKKVRTTYFTKNF